MENVIRFKLGTNTKAALQEEKNRFLRGSLESFGIDVSDWDINCTYDADLKIYIRDLVLKNSVIVVEDDFSISIERQPKKFTWRVKTKFISKEKDNNLCVNFIIETTTPG